MTVAGKGRAGRLRRDQRDRAARIVAETGCTFEEALTKILKQAGKRTTDVRKARRG